MANALIQVRIDETLKREASDLFEDLGLDIPTALRIFLKKAVATGGMPFEMRTDPFYGEKNQRYLREAIYGYETGNSIPVIKTMEELEKMAYE
jgi:DNA-damage-inducible protein J